MGQVPPHIGQVESLRVVGHGRNGPESLLSLNCQKGLIGNIAAVIKVIWVISRPALLRMANGQ